MPSFGSLFAGVGGFDLGFEAAGWECGFQVEWDKHCQQVLAHHWPDVPRWSDVSEVNGADLPAVDCITFGSPCQDLSVAGKRAGLEGGRSGLFFEATRIIREMRDATGNQYPRIAVWENVAGALSSNRGADFEAVLNEMGNIGALEQEWAVLDAQHFGVPQRRRRIFLVAVFDPAIARNCGSQILAVAKGRRGDSSKGKQQGQIIAADAAESLDGHLIIDGRRIDDVRVYSDGIVQTMEARMGTGGNNVPMIAYGIQGTMINRQDHNGPGGTGVTPVDGPMYTLTVADVHAVMQAIPIQDGREIEKRQNGFGIGNEGDPAYTLDTTGAQAVANKYAVRRLTPIECERLMGWPDDHTAGQADSHRYKQCGNGVAAPVAKWVAEQLNKVMQDA